MNNIKNNIKLISIIVGTLVGAGFASGKEIFLFFAQYGFFGVFSLIISSIIFFVIIYKTLLISVTYNIINFSDFLNLLLGKNNFKKYYLLIINIFLLFSFIIMIIGLSSFLYQEFKINKIFSCIITSTICFNIFKNNIRDILNINSVLNKPMPSKS